jgi:hypothetical protein
LVIEKICLISQLILFNHIILISVKWMIGSDRTKIYMTMVQGRNITIAVSAVVFGII